MEEQPKEQGTGTQTDPVKPNKGTQTDNIKINKNIQQDTSHIQSRAGIKGQSKVRNLANDKYHYTDEHLYRVWATEIRPKLNNIKSQDQESDIMKSLKTFFGNTDDEKKKSQVFTSTFENYQPPPRDETDYEKVSRDLLDLNFYDYFTTNGVNVEEGLPSAEDILYSESTNDPMDYVRAINKQLSAENTQHILDKELEIENIDVELVTEQTNKLQELVDRTVASKFDDKVFGNIIEKINKSSPKSRNDLVDTVVGQMEVFKNQSRKDFNDIYDEANDLEKQIKKIEKELAQKKLEDKNLGSLMDAKSNNYDKIMESAKKKSREHYNQLAEERRTSPAIVQKEAVIEVLSNIAKAKAGRPVGAMDTRLRVRRTQEELQSAKVGAIGQVLNFDE